MTDLEPGNGADQTPSRARLRFLSWNLAMFERSSSAPASWDQSATEAAVRQMVLDLSPDIVLFQELPGLVPYVESHDMIRANPRSHSGNLATLVSHSIMARQPSALVVTRTGILTTLPAADDDRAPITVANVHLSPGPGAAADRLRQLQVVVTASPTHDLVIIGDTNTRQGELPAIAELGLSPLAPPSPTWDSSRNRFRADGPAFTAYFTRVLTRGAVTIDRQKVLDDRPVEVDGHRFFLSDHFALTGSIVDRH